MRHNKSILLLSLFVVVSLLTNYSCTRYKDIVYLHEVDSLGHVGFYPYEVPEYRIQKRDVLYIKIITFDKETNDIINPSAGFAGNIFNNDAGFYLYGYTVNDSGNVEIPVLGEIHILGKTLNEAKAAIRTQSSKFLKDETIIIKLISFKYSVLGEVHRPGVYTNFNNQLTVLEAIAQAGDINEFGDKNKILVLRPSANGTKTFRLNLTNTKILESDGFFLLPNDIVYIEPVKSRNFRNNIPTYSLVLSTITTLLLIINYLDTN